LAEVLYNEEEAPFEALFSNMLVDKIVSRDDRCKLDSIIFYIYN